MILVIDNLIAYIGASALEFLLERPYQPCQLSNRLSLLMRGALQVTHEKARTKNSWLDRRKLYDASCMMQLMQ